MAFQEVWYWEGNVVESLVRHLKGAGWEIESVADTYTKAHGVDVIAQQGEYKLLVEVKGYPLDHYRDPRREGETKRTKPANQAQKWFAHALLAAIKMQTRNPLAFVAVAFPDFATYRKLFEETRAAFDALHIKFLLIEESGEVRELN